MYRKRTRFSEGWAKAAAIALIIGGIFVPVSTIMATSASQPRDDNGNSIIWGGCYTRTDCVDAMKNGDSDGHSGANITKIYNYFGINQTNLLDSTVPVTVYKNGNVVINEAADGFSSGATVGTDAQSVGRDSIGTDSRYISSIGVYERPTTTSFVANSITGYAYMPGGKISYFVLNSCGNAGQATPVTPPAPKPVPKPKPSPTPVPTVVPTPVQTPVPTPVPTYVPTPTPTPTPTFSCDSMSYSQPDSVNQPSQYQFTITPDTSGNVTITGYLFTFSNGSPAVMTDANTPYTTVNVTSGLTVYGQVETNLGTTPVSSNCSACVTVAPAAPTPSPVPSVTPTCTCTETPTPSATPVATPSATPAVLGASTSLPSTGPESALGGAGALSGIAMASRAYYRSRKSLLSAMRNKRTK